MRSPEEPPLEAHRLPAHAGLPRGVRRREVVWLVKRRIERERLRRLEFDRRLATRQRTAPQTARPSGPALTGRMIANAPNGPDSGIHTRTVRTRSTDRNMVASLRCARSERAVVISSLLDSRTRGHVIG